VAKIKMLVIFCNANLFLSTFCIYFLIFSLTNENRCDRIVSVLIFKPKFEKSRSEGNTVEKTTYHTAGRENLLHYLADRPNQRLTVEELTAALESAGFAEIAFFEDADLSAPTETAERWYIAARCKKKEGTV
jgi:hypothetical protein